MNPLEERIRRSQEGDKEARNQLVEDNLGLVHMVVRRFQNRGYEREELFQIGCIGLMKAIDQFDLSLQLAFSTYAVPLITGEIRRFLRDDGMVRVSRTVKEHACMLQKARQQLYDATGKEPDFFEIAKRAGISKEDALLAIEAGREVESLYRPVYGKDGEETYYIDLLGSTDGTPLTEEDPEKEAVLNRIAVRQVLDSLKGQERELLQLRYLEENTQCQTAEKMGMTQVQVSRMEKKILLRLRQRFV